ncbi:MAG: dUTP diphosphatase [Candidatus Kerfeldbacteria bacterium CG15_BIG_FIL_POST_REV_8_21_14_020_45_12]|uniref:dUTP diphosphatase n=1 Tax=Candidatus Kerfeldbacteria bacterium CG15_BIG_FIL_POST_REV_8_21_14_020_45_12 TaxID=2014247 RepID=A0A2M7H4L4_9BACT|nr:MAG: dUTP diphosphatase [Candidatus Kerfeldbacteria bacterium CG15_BIG_FIL_POST_REV_8_21_14_020_45_12]PJA93652.1 MAG: dUTP diphosphatase [Candidatus Kerfeldbacteria bacterium CG_4_9_14_3_um_filter_45_8]
MNLLIQKLRDTATLPEYAHAGDAGMDIFSDVQATLRPGERRVIETGIAMEIPTGYVGLIWEKSGRASQEGLGTLAGVIDSGYRGEVKIVLINHGDEPIVIERGQKIAQLLVQAVASVSIKQVNSLESSSRATAGFGSTGL